jgi:hypothetical protein
VTKITARCARLPLSVTSDGNSLRLPLSVSVTDLCDCSHIRVLLGSVTILPIHRNKGHGDRGGLCPETIGVGYDSHPQ